MNEPISHIYVLIDPRTEQVRYVGYSNNPQKRLRDHLAERGVTRKKQWIRSLRREGLLPLLQVVDSALASAIARREIEWIALYKAQGANLVNGTEGGDGLGTYKHTKEQHAKIGAANRGKKRSAETRRRISEVQIGSQLTLERRIRMSAERKGREFTPEHKDAVRAGVKASWQDPIKRSNRIAASIQARQSPEHHRKLSEAIKESWEKRREKSAD